MEKGKGVMGEGRRWAVDLTDNSTSLSSRNFPDPPGFSRASLERFFYPLSLFCFFDDSTVSRQKKDAESTWKAHKAWEVAQAPFKNLMMMGFMMWMGRSTVHLFSIGITFSALWYCEKYGGISIEVFCPTTFCFLLLQVTRLPPTKVKYPDIDRDIPILGRRSI
ncbi:ER membrane protein complex subunit 4 [Pyrus ussuriensis x Pyrus communis]|uniref:ER membrane protein complex subunit 4 n=1 Tax=Pyrus ussuriensis x Pyrus communis TaxID=2448454 RepID=A0A5N5FMC0_9ROSA|nr:ER membrane protein complex subunit 4 [Pyrus ussuriensis x Pyrus communis]